MRMIRLTKGRLCLLAAAAGKPRRLSIVGYTGGVMVVSGWGRIVVDLAGLDMPPTIPVLADHRNELAGVVGAGVPATDGRTLTVTATVAESDAGREVVSLLASGVPLAASMGSEPLTKSAVAAGESVTVNGRTLDGPFTLIHRAELREMTVTPVGADATTSVSLAARRAKAAAMTFEEYVTSLGLDPEAITDEVREALQKAFEASTTVEAEAVEEEEEEEEETPPTNAAAVVGLLASSAPHLAARAVRERWPMSRAKTEALAFIRASRPSPPGVLPSRPGTGGTAGAVEAAILIKAGYERAAVKSYGEQTVEAARRLPNNLPELTASLMRSKGRQVSRDRGEMIQAAMSGGDLTVSLSNVANKILETVWRETPATWRSWCAVRNANNFKEHSSLRPTFGGNLAPTGRGGTIDHGDMDEDVIPWKVAQYAKRYVVSREDLIDDDAGVFSEMMPGFARAAERTLANLVYYVLLSNAGTHFTVGRGNTQSGGGSVLAHAGLAVAVKQMRNMTDPSGSYLNLPPAVLVVGSDLEETARGLLASTEVLRDQSSDNQPTGNVFQGLAKLEVEPRVSGGTTDPKTGTTAAGSTTQWFLFGGPVDLPMIVGFLGDKQAPTVESFGLQSDPSRLAMSWRVYHDFGAAMGDYRAGQRSLGA